MPLTYTPLVAVGSVPTPPTFPPGPQQAAGSTLPVPWLWSTVSWVGPKPPPASPFGGRDFPLAIKAQVALPPPARAALNTAFTFTFGAWGGYAPFTWASTGSLPTGLTLSTAGVLSGTPTAAGTYNFTVTPTDAWPTAGQALPVTIVVA